MQNIALIAKRALRALALLSCVVLGGVSALGSGGNGGGGGDVNHPPVAVFATADVREADTPPLTINLSASLSSDPDGSIVSYAWDFGDGTTAIETVATVSHTYESSGGFDVSLTVTDDDGATDTMTQVDFVRIGGSFSISGVMTAAPGSAVDGDVNDPLATYLSNDSAPQPVPNPGVVGGYASWVGTGVAGDRFGSSGDVFDRFAPAPDLFAGQRITLWIADHDALAPAIVDLDLYLCARADTDCPRAGGAVDGPLNEAAIIASSIGVAATETITVATTGSYDIVVEGFNGLSNYVLAIGQDAPVSAQQSDPLSIDADFVPGDVIVRFKAGDALLPMGARVEGLGLKLKAGRAGGPLLLGLGQGQDAERAFKALGIDRKRTVRPTGVAVSAVAQRAQAKQDTIALVKALRAREDVASADLNYIRRAKLEPNDSLYSRQWHYPLINLPSAWDFTTDSAGDVIVAVVDTGVLVGHPDLSSKLTTTGYDFVSDLFNSGDGDGIDDDPDDPGDSPSGGSSFHGTHVAGTIAASSNNGVGVAGVAWGSRIMAVRALGLEGVGTSYDTIQAVRYAAGLANDSGITLSAADRADIINLSLGGPAYSSAEQAAFDAVRAAGVIVVAAAGNDGSSVLNYPASYDGVISVSAVDCAKNPASYSNFGPAIDVAAPGGDFGPLADCSDGVLSTVGDDAGGSVVMAYGEYVGTSMAAPHAAGVLALMKSVDPLLSPDDVDAVLARGAITEDSLSDGATVRNDFYGYGLIDALAAVQEAERLQNGGLIPAVLSVTPTALTFYLSTDTQDSATASASNLGEEALSIDAVAVSCDPIEDAGCADPVNVAWLSVAYQGSGADGLGSYLITAQRGALDDGVYTASVTFSGDNGQDVRLRVTLVVGLGAAAHGDAGRQYVLLLDPVTYTPQQQFDAEVDPNTGTYSYEFTGVPVGSYVVLSGTDLDNDFIICDAGEACGGWPDADSQQSIQVVDSNVTGLDFQTGFRILTSTAAAGADQRGVNRVSPQSR